jgi:hypothetical protein
MPLPTFVVVGAARCGTTALHNQLDGHPDIAMTAVKEPNYFAFRQDAAGPVPLVDEHRIVVKSVPERAAYERLFTTSGRRVAAYGDISPLYLYVRESAGLIADAVPDARIIAILRDPVERAYSHFLLTYEGDPDAVGTAFAEVCEAEWDLPYTPFRSGTHVLRLGRYWEQLTRYYDRFPAEQVLAVAYADLAADPAGTLRRICAFVGVRTDVDLADARGVNASGIPRPGLAGRAESGMRRVQPYVKRALPARAVAPVAALRERMRRSLVTTAPAVDPALRARLLTDYYAADLAAVENELGLRLVGA